MAEFSITSKSPGDGHEYQIRDGNEWRTISEDEAKRLGIWRDPRGGQYAVRDSLANDAQVGARDKGMYDPRPASGDFIADLVLVRCAECGARTAMVEEYEKRVLVHHLPSGRRYWTDLDRWSLYGCANCDRAPRVDTAKVRAGIERAKSAGKKITVKV